MNKLHFVLNNKIREIDFAFSDYSPTTTVLKYLRSLQGFKGVKEGCAEGDCGACTVVIAEIEGKNLKYKAVDSCLVFLPMLQGKQLITIENLQHQNGDLHPVQESMIKSYGSQCGYCTPGIIMTLFAAYKNNHSTEIEEIKKTLSGNLCRCTGYKPIIEAAQNVFSYIKDDHFSFDENKTIKLLNTIKCEKGLEFFTEKQRYIKPIDLSEAIFYRQLYPESIMINGNTDIALKVTKRNELLPEIIDLSDLKELNFIKKTKNSISIGSGTSIEDIRIAVKDDLPALSNMLSYFGSKQIRNLATLGGNIGSASPIGDTLPVLIAHEATIILKNGGDTRKIDIEKFITSYRKTDIHQDEIIYGIEIPIPAENHFIRSYKVSKRREMDISTVSACFNLEKENADNTVYSVILTYGGMAATPKRALQTEAFLKNKKWIQENIEEAVNILKYEFNPISDARSGEKFRSIVAGNLLQLFFNETISENHNISKL